MDKTNKRLLDNNYKEEMAAMKARVEQEEAVKLSNSSGISSQTSYAEKLKAATEARMKDLSPKLEAEIYVDFGGSREAATDLHREQMRKDREAQQQERQNQKVARQEKAKEQQDLVDKQRQAANQNQKEPSAQKTKEQQLEAQRNQLRQKFKDRSNQRSLQNDQSNQQGI